MRRVPATKVRANVAGVTEQERGDLDEVHPGPRGRTRSGAGALNRGAARDSRFGCLDAGYFSLGPDVFVWTAMLSSFRTTDATVPRRPDAYATTPCPLFFIPSDSSGTRKGTPATAGAADVGRRTGGRSEASQREPARTGYRRNFLGTRLGAAGHRDAPEIEP